MATPQNPKSLALIVGAGASNEAGLPVGAELKRQIADALNIQFDHGGRKTSGDDHITEAFKFLARSAAGRSGDINPLLRTSWRIRDAMPQAISIDNFIDSHRDDEQIATCGKLAIARCILAAEEKSKLQIDRSNIYNKMDFKALEATWFNSFFQLITENCRREDLPARFQKLVIISFNYDRCIEHYLYHALQNYYGMTDKEAAEALTSLEVHHPYGKVGALPWIDRAGGIEFGATPKTTQLLALSNQLKTFTEGTDASTSDISSTRDFLASADRIAFLGFAFHRLNLELLLPDLQPRSSPTSRPVFATALGISKSDAQLIAQDLARMGGLDYEYIKMRTDLTCAQLFVEYRRSMSLY